MEPIPKTAKKRKVFFTHLVPLSDCTVLSEQLVLQRMVKTSRSGSDTGPLRGEGGDRGRDYWL